MLAAGDWWSSHLDGGSTSVAVDGHGGSGCRDLARALAAGPAGVVALQVREPRGRHPPAGRRGRGAGARHGVPLFTDAAAAVGRVDLPDGWAAAAASAHKWGGPAGVGVLLVRKGARWRAPFPVDDRTDARVAGFENVPAVLAAAAALQAVLAERDKVGARQRTLVDRLRAGWPRSRTSRWSATRVTGSPTCVTFSCLYVDGEALVTELDRHGFAVASGSACTASTPRASHVLAAMGGLTHGNVRVSLGRDTTAEDVDRLLAVCPASSRDLRARRPGILCRWTPTWSSTAGA